MLHPDVDLDALRDQFANAEPFGHVVIEKFLDEQKARDIEQALPSYLEALHAGTSFTTVNESKKVQIEDTQKYAPPVVALHDFLNSAEFRETLEYICGIEDLRSDPKSNGGGIHQTGPGGRLDVHVDFNYLPELNAFRRLNLLLYLLQESGLLVRALSVPQRHQARPSTRYRRPPTRKVAPCQRPQRMPA